MKKAMRGLWLLSTISLPGESIPVASRWLISQSAQGLACPAAATASNRRMHRSTEAMGKAFISSQSVLRICAALALCAAISAAATEPGSLKESGTSGIKGIVLLGPRCPGPVRQEQPCPDAPYKTVLLIKRVSDGKTIAKAESNENGRFRTALPPGRYFIVNVPGPTYPAIHSPEIVVRRKQFTFVEIHADTGMR